MNNPNINMPPPPSPAPRLVAILLLISLLATAAILNKKAQTGSQTGTERQNSTPVDIKAAQARYGFGLQEVAKQAGINFTHHPPQLDPKLDHIMPEIAAMGASVSVVDFDRDGWNDLYVTDSGEDMPNHLYHNNHDGTFTDVAAQMGVADLNQPGTGASMGAVWGDFDNDGYEDLLVYKWGRCELFHNDGGKDFTRVTDKAGLPAWANINSAIWLDYDRDGHLDLLLCGYYPEDVDLWHLKTTRIMPDSFEYAKNGGRKYLLRNRGDGTFEDVTEQIGLTATAGRSPPSPPTCAARATPTSSSPTITASPNTFSTTKASISRKSAERTYLSGHRLGRGPKSGMNASLGDILNQGKFAIYVSNICEQGQLMQGNNLWVPRRKAGREKQHPTPNTQHPSPLHQHGARHGRGIGRMEFWGAVWRLKQRRQSGFVPDERLYIRRPE